MDLRKASPYLLVAQLLIVVVLLFQVNAVSNTLAGISGDIVIADSDDDTVPSGAAAADSDPVDVNTDGDSIIHGDPDTAAVVMVEYSDFECPFCARASPTIEGLIEEYGDDLAIVYKDFPLSFHAEAEGAAIAAECADEQGEFKAYHDLLFEASQGLSDAAYLAYAEEIGLDIEEFTACQDDPAILAEVNTDISEGSADGVRGTPAFFVNGELISGAQPQSVFEAAIDAAL
tara:strand:+ start:6815 stop:7507 length:693 start_codon:yes stop_codon:yes gene_type:complete